MQTCPKCRKPMDPKISLDGSVGDILRRVAMEAKYMEWTCPRCRIEREAPLSAKDAKEIQSFIRRKKKQWWQFWIR